jgi:hypothetical protein
LPLRKPMSELQEIVSSLFVLIYDSKFCLFTAPTL